jgi:hypothetical protein
VRKPLSVLAALVLAAAAVTASAAAAAGASTGPTSVTFTISTGVLSLTAPDTASFGTVTLGALSVSGSLGS